MARTSKESAVAETKSTRAKGQTSQSEFIREFLTNNPEGSASQANQKWEKAGNTSPLNSSLFYQVRAKMGLSAKGTGRRVRRGSDDQPNKSEYIRKNLLENPELSATELGQLWQQEGFPGELSPALYYQVKRRMGIAGSRRGPRARKVNRRTTQRTVNALNRRYEQYLRLELTLDSLIHEAESIGDAKLASALNQARRQIASALI